MVGREKGGRDVPLAHLSAWLLLDGECYRPDALVYAEKTRCMRVNTDNRYDGVRHSVDTRAREYHGNGAKKQAYGL